MQFQVKWPEERNCLKVPTLSMTALPLGRNFSRSHALLTEELTRVGVRMLRPHSNPLCAHGFPHSEAAFQSTWQMA